MSLDLMSFDCPWMGGGGKLSYGHYSGPQESTDVDKGLWPRDETYGLGTADLLLSSNLDPPKDHPAGLALRPTKSRLFLHI
jgi:hypothetical protein